MLAELILEAQKGNKETMMLLINKFQPIIKKYSRLLHYEDASQDLTYFFLKLVLEFKIDDKNKMDYQLLAYIKVAVHNHYIYLIKKLIKKNQEVYMSSLSELQRNEMEYNLSAGKESDPIFKIYLKDILSPSEYKMIYYIYVQGFSSSDLARIQGITRQAVNQKKNRILKKIKESQKKS